ncbi:DUF167 family protein [Phyllobacterium sp. K27]
MANHPFRKGVDSLTLFVRLTPKSAKDAIEGVETTDDGRAHLKVRVRAIPEDGKANAALRKLLAKWLDVAPRNVTIVAGATSRLKQVRLESDPDSLIAKLSGLLQY